jgi:hypothetical protein
VTLTFILTGASRSPSGPITHCCLTWRSRDWISLRPRLPGSRFLDFLVASPRDFVITETPKIRAIPARHCWDPEYRKRVLPHSIVADNQPGASPDNISWADTRSRSIFSFSATSPVAALRAAGAAGPSRRYAIWVEAAALTADGFERAILASQSRTDLTRNCETFLGATRQQPGHLRKAI